MSQMRLEKIVFDREGDQSWLWLSEDGEDYKLTLWENHSGGYSDWNTAQVELPDPSYKPEAINLPENDFPSEDGVRILYPGTTEETQAPFSLTDTVHEGLLGEAQAAAIYSEVSDQLSSEDIGLHDFVEWYQQESEGFKENIVEYGPELVFGLDESGAVESLREYMRRHEFDGTSLRSSQDGEVVAQVSSERGLNSILAQADIGSVDGILTKNPDQVEQVRDYEQ